MSRTTSFILVLAFVISTGACQACETGTPVGEKAEISKRATSTVVPVPEESRKALEDKTHSRARFEMVEGTMIDRDITSPRVIQAMRNVPRHEFVPAELRSMAYQDRPLPIGWAQTISQPYIVALMTQLLDPRPDEKVLEIGTGSGYQAAVLGLLADEVYTIEIVEPLGQRATQDLKRLGYKNVRVRIGDGYRGWPEEAPFDGIMVTAAPETVPKPLIEQLKVGGRMVIPVGPMFGAQELQVLRKTEKGLERETSVPVRFVPMTGEAMDRK